MLTRSRSSSRSMSVDSTNVSEEESFSREASISRQASTASSSTYFDSQDSAPSFDAKPSSSSRNSSLTAKAEPTQWVMILPTSEIVSNETLPQFINYPDPHSGLMRRYLLSHDGKAIYEINKSTGNYRSWFIGDTVQSDGSLYVCTYMDPLFLVLDAIMTASKSKLNNFCTIDIILDYENFPRFKILEKLVSDSQWDNITDSKDNPITGERVYRYSKERTLNWLSKKVERLAQTLKEESIYVGTGSQSSDYKRGSILTASHDDYLHYASGMIQDYLPLSLASELANKFPSTTTCNGKRSIDHDECQNDQPAKKRSTSKSEPNEDYSKLISSKPVPVKTVTKMSSAQKALTKVDKKGMKTMNSFFKQI